MESPSAIENISVLCKTNQIKEITHKCEDGRFRTLKMEYGDECGNGHNTFTWLIEEGRNAYHGWHREVEVLEWFPEFSRIAKWHLCSTDGPLHYISNTLYTAGDRDCYGLKEGETRQWKNRNGELGWSPKKRIDESIYSNEKPESVTVEYIPYLQIGEGKKREFDAARRIAIWPEATDEQLSLPPNELEKLLLDRLPNLLAEFREMVESLGFIY